MIVEKSLQKKITREKKSLLGFNFYLIFTLLFTVFIYLGAINRPWQPFDESVYFEEVHFPVPYNFNELVEVIKTFAPIAHIESINTFFSNYMTIRAEPLNSMIVILLLFLFKKNAILYHIFQYMCKMIVKFPV